MARMQYVAKIDKFCSLEKLTIPVLNTVKWRAVVDVKKTRPAAQGRTKAILATIEFVLTLADVAKCIA